MTSCGSGLGNDPWRPNDATSLPPLFRTTNRSASTTLAFDLDGTHRRNPSASTQRAPASAASRSSRVITGLLLSSYPLKISENGPGRTSPARRRAAAGGRRFSLACYARQSMCMFPLAIGGQKRAAHPAMSPFTAKPEKIIWSARPLDELSVAQMKHAANIVDPSGVVRKHGSTPGTQRGWFWADITPGPEYARLMFVSLSTALNVPVTGTASPVP